jgi:hypothetical protein
VLIGFLASLLGLGGISAKIRSIIEKIQQPVNTAIDWVINKAVSMVKAAGQLLGFGKEEPKAEEEKEGIAAGLAEFQRPREIRAGRENHTAWIGPDGRAMIASEPTPARAAVRKLRDRLEKIPLSSRPADADTKIAQAEAAVGPVETQTAQSGGATGRAAPAELRKEWDAFIVKLSEAYSLFGTQGDMQPFPFSDFNFNIARYTGAARVSYMSECKTQLRDQQTGINNLKAGEWHANRTRYTAVARSASDTESLREYRDLLRDEAIRIQRQILEAQNVQDPERQQKAEARANSLLSGHAILHIPDQVAGGALLFPNGKPTAVNNFEIQVGRSSVNSAIGSGWGHKAGELAKLTTLAEQADPVSRMNVVLTPNFT